MTDQQQILNDLAQLLHTHRPNNDYQSAHIEYEHATDGSWSSFSGWFITEGKTIAPVEFSKLKEKAEILCNALHQTMKAENNWLSFQLDLENGKVKVQFNSELIP